MMHRKQWQLGLAIFLAMGGLTSATTSAVAQSNIVPDNTLGAEQSNVIQNVNGLPVEVITGGAQRGQNLFHSFREFNVSAGRGAYFFSPDAIQNILTRVTGTNRSEILGTLGTFGNSQPNLFLINPNGIIFGPNASLDVRGSFVATTANAVQFGNQGNFSATNPQPPTPLLTINPSAFFFTARERQAEIINQSQARQTVLGGATNGLRVRNGRSLLLLGGDVTVDGGELNAWGGRVEVGAAAGTGSVGLNANGSLSVPEGMQRANVSFTNQARVDVTLGNGGDLSITAGNINVLGGSLLKAGIDFGLGALGSQAGDLTLNATGEIRVGQSSSIENDVQQRATGNSGNLTIKTSSLVVSDGAQLSATTYGLGNAGSVVIQARDQVIVDDGQIIAGVFRQAAGNGGNITIEARQLTVSGDTLGVISTSTLGQGNAGNLSVETEQLILKGGGQLTVDTRSTGNGGNLTVRASRLVDVSGTSTDGKARSGLTVDTFGAGHGGNLRIQTDALIVRDGARVAAQVSENATGAGGNVVVEANHLRLQNGGQISAGSFGRGNGGTLAVNASDSVEVIGVKGGSPSGLFTATYGEGNAGDLTITTSRLSIREGGTVSASTAAIGGRGQGGNLTVNASDSIEISGYTEGENGRFLSSLFSETGRLLATVSGIEPANGGTLTINTGNLIVVDGGIISTATFALAGQAGSLKINTGQLFVRNAQITSSTSGQGNGGNLDITVSGLADLSGQGGIFAQVNKPASLSLDGDTQVLQDSTGAGGNLTFRAGQLTVRDGSGISASTVSRGAGGQVNIVTGQLTVDRALVSVSSLGSGAAGNLDITADSIKLDNRASLSAFTASGDGGNIRIQSRDLLLLRRGSQISATAGLANQSGNGGNITINAPRGFIVGVKQENSDITANAFTGSGGRINITAQGIYGLQFRPQLTPFSDITASSQLGVSGVVLLNTPDVDPSRGLLQLPVTLADASQQIVQSCVPKGPGRASSFVITGRGGIPSSPTEPLQDESVLADWVNVGNETRGQEERRGHGDAETRRESGKHAARRTPNAAPPNEIIEANAWFRDTDGTIVLVAIAPTTIPRNPVLTPVFCP